MKRKMRITTLILALIIVFALQCGVYAQDIGQAVDGQTLDVTQLTEVSGNQPDVWAQEGVSWSNDYGLVSTYMLSDYRSDVKEVELFGVACNLYEKATGKLITPLEESPFMNTDHPAVRAACAIGILSGSGEFPVDKTVTREEMAAVIYNTLVATELDQIFDSSADSSEDAMGFFISNGLLKGRGGNNMCLEYACTRQELMVFIHRVYEFVAYETGNYSKGLFWKASDEDSTVYLLGSIHLADQSLYPLSKDILNAFESSDTLVLEADLSRLNEDIVYMQQKMMYTGDDTLDKNVPKEVYDKFVEVVAPMGLPPEMYNKFKPWYAAMLVQSLSMTGGGDTTGGSVSSDLGIDMHFTAKAADSKQIAEIEGLKFQVDMFDSFSNEIQTWYLKSSLPIGEATQQATNDAFKYMLTAWKNGDAETIEAMVTATDNSVPEAVEFNTVFWNTRNNNMYEKTKGFLADPENKTYFIVVGAGHMEGETGVVTQLSENGFNVERILN